MLKSNADATLLLKLGTRICVCMRKKRMDEGLLVRLRPLIFGGYAFWCDKPDAG